MTKFRQTILAILIFISSSFAPVASVQAQDVSCDDVQFVFARGSGESLDGPSYTAWRDSITIALAGSSLRYSFYELGRTKQDNFQYPAVTVSGSFANIGHLLGAFVSGGQSFEFGASVVEGSSELKAYITKTHQACPSTKFVLGGYSQGAMLISRVLDQLPAEQIVYVATFGDPKLYLPEGKGVPSAACLGRYYSNYRVHVPDCQAYEGVLGSYRPYQPEAFIDKLGTWCNEHDLMCSSGMSIDDHTSYVSSGLYQSAAQTIRSKLALAFPEHFDLAASPTVAKHNLAILIDSTQSMASMIDRYKKEALRLARIITESGGQVALYEYRDLDDPFVPVLCCDFGCTLDEFQTQLDLIEVAEGGDDPESALSAIMTAMNTLKWQPSATKSIVLLTDADYLMPDRDGVTLADVVQRSLEIDPVNVYIITRTKWLEFYQDFAASTNGQVFNVRDQLELSTATILGRPVAILPQSAYTVQPGAEVAFDASASYSTNSSALYYDWDLDGDGEFELLDRGARATQVYDQPQQHFIQVRVSDTTGHSSTMSALLTVAETKSSAPATVQALTTKAIDQTTARIDFETDAPYLLVSLDDAILGFIDPAQHSLALHDVRPGMTVTLTPYNAEQTRGTARSIQLSLPMPTVPNTGSPLLESGRWANYLRLVP